LNSTEIAARLAPIVRDVAHEAGRIAMGYFIRGEKTSARIWNKSGGSPVTEADVSVDAFLKVRLSQVLPEAGWLSEETTDDAARLVRRLVWIVDPIDGTRAFMSGNPDWSVAIGLLQDAAPIFGIVNAPVHGAFYEAMSGAGATRNGEAIRVASRETLAGARIAGPIPLLERAERSGAAIERAPRVPSLALRIVRIADGSLDAGLVSTDARDWDIAAADLILREAGGRLTRFDGAPPRYNERDPVHGELAGASHGLHPSLLEAMRHPRAVTDR
jgi:myo-inositol-1(or 4)-monophosphatase